MSLFGSVFSSFFRIFSSLLLSSQEKGSNFPNTVCCTTGNLYSTSKWYILIIPLFTFCHSWWGTWLMSFKYGECSPKGPVFIWKGYQLTLQALLNLIDEFNTAQVEVLVGIGFHYFFGVYWLWFYILVAHKLCCTPHKRQELVIVKSPHSMRTRWLEHVRLLNLPHQLQVPERMSESGASLNKTKLGYFVDYLLNSFVTSAM